ncbi:uncharacterized protein EKO05_0007503 [Ascochyta rabiei]|uniref:uncharacterized protein n=1 Tax=Didymella rabiei TaxID=5454 RepID=UPI0021FE45D1|nr:uncharacterized protein EKO05_0007503 [Ascochyta rabiei]UPX17127.1 hypothetical protein EKO05_0007503 [Ascochyta rabiei]
MAGAHTTCFRFDGSADKSLHSSIIYHDRGGKPKASSPWPCQRSPHRAHRSHLAEICNRPRLHGAVRGRDRLLDLVHPSSEVSRASGFPWQSAPRRE